MDWQFVAVVLAIVGTAAAFFIGRMVWQQRGAKARGMAPARNASPLTV